MPIKIHKRNRKLTPVATALLLAFASCTASAAKKDDHDHEMEQHGSHEHGVARLTLATTDDGLEIALESPAANVFGFEHAAKSAEERGAVQEAMAKLKDGTALFSVNASAACKLENVTVEAAVADSHDEHDHEEKHDDHAHEKEEKHDDHDHGKKEKHDEHKHEKEGKHDDHAHEKEEKHDDHDHENKEKHDDDGHADKESHSDVEAVWALHCEKPAAIETVNVKLFSAFPKGFEDIAVEWITASGAGKVDLEADGEVSLRQ